MTLGKQHLNKPLISLTDGTKLGEIKDLYLNGALTQVAAILVASEGLLTRKFLGIDRVHIRVYGRSAWLVSDSDKVEDMGNILNSEAFVLLSNLHGREVQTEGGTKVGAVEDVILDAQAHILGFTFGKVFLQGPLAERRAIAREVITSVGNGISPMTTILEQAEIKPVSLDE